MEAPSNASLATQSMPSSAPESEDGKSLGDKSSMSCEADPAIHGSSSEGAASQVGGRPASQPAGRGGGGGRPASLRPG